MLRTRVIPILLLHGESLVKTVRFGRFAYVGDPCNTVRIFNELEVDELILLDVTASRERRGPNLRLLADVASECFMPLAYGGGIDRLDHARAVFDIGVEKVAVNTHAVANPSLVADLSGHYGSQAVIASIDVKRSLLGRPTVRTLSGRRRTGLDAVDWARRMEQQGAGEILLTSIDREGTWQGFDLPLVRDVVQSVSIPVIAHGGAGSPAHIEEAVNAAGAAAAGVGSLVVFQKRGCGVLVNFPDESSLAGIPR